MLGTLITAGILGWRFTDLSEGGIVIIGGILGWRLANLSESVDEGEAILICGKYVLLKFSERDFLVCSCNSL